MSSLSTSAYASSYQLWYDIYVTTLDIREVVFQSMSAMEAALTVGVCDILNPQVKMTSFILNLIMRRLTLCCAAPDNKRKAIILHNLFRDFKCFADGWRNSVKGHGRDPTSGVISVKDTFGECLGNIEQKFIDCLTKIPPPG